MSSMSPARLAFPRSQAEWACWYARAMALFALQGVVILALYAQRGWDTPPDALPYGLQLDPAHGAIHLLWGLAGAYVGFRQPAAAVRFVQVFSAFYLLLAVFGTFTRMSFGLQLELPENALHWTLGLITAAIGFGPSLLSTSRGR